MSPVVALRRIGSANKMNEKHWLLSVEIIQFTCKPLAATSETPVTTCIPEWSNHSCIKIMTKMLFKNVHTRRRRRQTLFLWGRAPGSQSSRPRPGWSGHRNPGGGNIIIIIINIIIIIISSSFHYYLKKVTHCSLEYPGFLTGGWPQADLLIVGWPDQSDVIIIMRLTNESRVLWVWWVKSQAGDQVSRYVTSTWPLTAVWQMWQMWCDISVNMTEHLVSEGTMMSLLSSVLMSSLKQADLS